MLNSVARDRGGSLVGTPEPSNASPYIDLILLIAASCGDGPGPGPGPGLTSAAVGREVIAEAQSVG